MPPTRPPTPTLGRQLRAVGVLLVVLAGLAGVAWGVYRGTVGRPLLAGEHRRDFGTVMLEGQALVLEHTFVLSNRTGDVIEIEGVRTTCGCTVAEPNIRSIEPGASVDIAATLTLKRDGRKTAKVFLMCSNGRREVLRLDAAARKSQRLSPGPGPGRLEPGRPLTRVIFYIDYDSNKPPPPPRLAAPAGVRAEFTQWTQTTRRQRTQGLPARWRGEVRLELEADTLPDHAFVAVEMAPDQKVSIPLAK